MLIFILNLIVCFSLSKAEPLRRIGMPQDAEEFILNQTETRRILSGHEVGDTRPYMVYLRPASSSDRSMTETNWLCGGVIIHERHILTSAACIEDVKQFYVISGTHRWVPYNVKNNNCINYGAKKAVWKCVPKSYVYDGKDFDNIRWAIGDIAVVKIEDEFNFQRRVEGCDFVPKMIPFNNISVDHENAGTQASIAGWGSTESFSDGMKVARASSNSPILLETDVIVISKQQCKRRWPERYHHIIDGHMICGKDVNDVDAMSKICAEQEINCKELIHSDEEEEAGKNLRKQMKLNYFPDPEDPSVHMSSYFNDSRRSKLVTGGFCENDHGGPLVVGHGQTAMVVGVISACQTADFTRKCYGPFLYTSVYKYRHLISCACNKGMGNVFLDTTCRMLLRTQTSETNFDWSSHNQRSITLDTNVVKRIDNLTKPPKPLRN